MTGLRSSISQLRLAPRSNPDYVLRDDTQTFDIYTHFAQVRTVRTNIVIDDDLMNTALKVTGLGTKRAVVEQGLRALIDIHGQAAMRKWRGKVRWRGDLDELRRDSL